MKYGKPCGSQDPGLGNAGRLQNDKCHLTFKWSRK
jgi:hypothetical protein